MKTKAGMLAAHRGSRLRPERRIHRRRAVAGPGTLAPGPLDDVRQEQHGHVAADAVAALGDTDQLGRHGPAQARRAIVELQGVGPAGEIRVAAMRQDARRRPAGSCAARGPGRHRCRRCSIRDAAGPRHGRAPCDWGRNRAAAARRAAAAARAAEPAPRRRRTRRATEYAWMAKGEPLISSSLRSGSRLRYSARHCGCRRDTSRPAGPVCHTPSGQSQSKPRSATLSRKRSSKSSSVAGRPTRSACSVSQTRVFT